MDILVLLVAIITIILVALQSGEKETAGVYMGGSNLPLFGERKERAGRKVVVNATYISVSILFILLLLDKFI